MFKTKSKSPLVLQRYFYCNVGRDIVLLSMLLFYEKIIGSSGETGVKSNPETSVYNAVINVWGDLLLSFAKQLLHGTIKYLLVSTSPRVNITPDTWRHAVCTGRYGYQGMKTRYGRSRKYSPEKGE